MKVLIVWICDVVISTYMYPLVMSFPPSNLPSHINTKRSVCYHDEAARQLNKIFPKTKKKPQTPGIYVQES